MTRREFGAITVGTALSGRFDRAAALLSQTGSASSIFPYGTHVYREPSLPLEQLRADFPVLKRLGFNMIKIQESWSADEVTEGHIDLSRVENVVAYARENGLLVYFGVTMEQAPAWLWRKFPDATMRYENNQPVIDPTQYLLPNDGKPGPCWNHAGARESAIRFIEAVGKQIGKYNNILVWNVWQEIGFGFDQNVSRVCFCPHTLAAFRAWARQKYGSLEALNKVWQTHYAAWEEVDPPRVFTKVPSAVDWRFFMENVYLGNALRWKAEAFRRSDPGKRQILAHAAGPRFGSAEDWTMARSGLDIYGSSCYPGWGEFEQPGVSNERRLKESPAPALQAQDNAFKWDYIRSASVKGAFWTAELQGGRAAGGITPGRVPDPGDIRRWVMGALAGGARGICFWNHRSEVFWDEAYGFGLLELEGDRTARAEEAGRLGKAVHERGADLVANGSTPEAPVAVIVDEPMWDFVYSSGEPLRPKFVEQIRGVHRILWENAIPVDFLSSADLHEKGALYKAAILPFPISMSDSLMDCVTDYVHAGGTLISGPAPGRFSAVGFGTAGEMPQKMIDLFGVRHKQILTLSERSGHPTQSSYRPTQSESAELSGAGPYAAHRITADFYLQYLTTTVATPVLRSGDDVAGTVNRVGKGQSVLIGTLFGIQSDSNAAFLTALLASAGARPDRVGKLARRRRRLDHKEAWFLFNPTRDDIEEEFAIAPFQNAQNLLDDERAAGGGRIRVRVPALNFACILLS